MPQGVSHLPPQRWAHDLGWLITPHPPGHRNWLKNSHVSPSTFSRVSTAGHQQPRALMKSLPPSSACDGFIVFQPRPARLRLPGSPSSSMLLHSGTSRIATARALQPPGRGQQVPPCPLTWLLESAAVPQARMGPFPGGRALLSPREDEWAKTQRAVLLLRKSPGRLTRGEHTAQVCPRLAQLLH